MCGNDTTTPYRKDCCCGGVKTKPSTAVHTTTTNAKNNFSSLTTKKKKILTSTVCTDWGGVFDTAEASDNHTHVSCALLQYDFVTGAESSNYGGVCVLFLPTSRSSIKTQHYPISQIVQTRLHNRVDTAGWSTAQKTNKHPTKQTRKHAKHGWLQPTNKHTYLHDERQRRIHPHMFVVIVWYIHRSF